MQLRSTIPCLALAALLGGTGISATYAQPRPTTQRMCPSNYTPIHERLKPLMDLIAEGEGDYNSVNRGRAGDTPGGIEYIMGRTFDEYTVKDVIRMQDWMLYAVGRYQFIPSTLRFAVAMSDVDMDDKFTPEVQDRLMAALILYKRPAIGAYLRGDHNYVGWALDELAKEWASVEYRNGRGFYDHIGGNRAHITRKEAWEVLQTIKKGWLTDLGLLS